jgi:gamma-glutamylcyclotransferase (GGCT)/AIG2-like uncharacterized protein YtfP
MSDLLFVYGTLRPGAESDRGPGKGVLKTMQESAERVGAGRIRGRLHWVSWYPGVLESRNTNDIVKGDVYRLRDAESVLATLDRYEGAAPLPSTRHEYTRRKKLVTLTGGRRAFAWVYIYNRPQNVGERIASGDFLRSARQRRGRK